MGYEATLGGGVEICDAPKPKPEPQSCKRPELGDTFDPPGIPIPRKFGGAFSV